MFSAINLLIGLALASSAYFVEANDDIGTLAKLCQGKKVHLETANQVIKLDGLTVESCPSSVSMPLYSLAQLVKEDYSEPSCGPTKIGRMNDFYRRYLKADPNRYSTPVQEAYIAYGLRLSELCREDMINQIMTRTNRFLNEDDYATLNKWTREGGPISKLFDSEKSNGLALPSAMVKLLKGQYSAYKADSYIQVSPQSSLAKQRNVCKRRFLPIYSMITSPLLDLATKGFNYNGKDEPNRDQETVRKVSEWYRIVFICETLAHVNIIEDPNMEVGDVNYLEGNDGYFEAEKHRTEEAGQQPEIELVEYDRYVGAERGDGLLVEPKDSRLKKAIKDFHEPSLQLSSKAKLSKLANKASKSVCVQSSSDDDGLGKFLESYSRQIDQKNGVSTKRSIVKAAKKYFFEPLAKGLDVIPTSIINVLLTFDTKPGDPRGPLWY